jgi:uncharacterized membrane protein required for colicin V production
MQNLLEFLRQFNWIDILVFAVFLRVSLVALKTGLPFETLKISGTFFAIYLSIHYNSSLANSFISHSGNQNSHVHFFRVLAFLILAFLGYLVFVLIRLVVCRFIKTEVTPALSKWGGFAFGLLRALLLCSIILSAFMLSGVVYFKKSIHNSLSGATIAKVAPSTYSWFWHKVMSKFVAKEKFNDSALEVK